jgi:anti-sigma regulatory factor (Ser/Thr protein kinase)
MPAKYARTANRRSSFAFKLEPGAHAPAEARQELQARLPGILAPELIDDVLLLTTELVTNSVRHSPAATDGTVDVGVRLAQDRIRVEVSDPGRGFSHVPQHPGTLSEGGRGLFLVEALSDRWGTDGGERTTVWFELGVDHNDIAGASSSSAAARPQGEALGASSALGQVEGGSEPRARNVESDVLELAADLRALASANAALQVRARTMEAELARVSEGLRAGAETLRTRQNVARPRADA